MINLALRTCTMKVAKIAVNGLQLENVDQLFFLADSFLAQKVEKKPYYGLINKTNYYLVIHTN